MYGICPATGRGKEYITGTDISMTAGGKVTLKVKVLPGPVASTAKVGSPTDPDTVISGEELHERADAAVSFTSAL